MRAWAHDGGFSVDGSVRIEGADRTELERLLRTCARPPFALEHLHQRDAEHLVTRNPTPARGTATGARPTALLPTPLELITKIAALAPLPRAHCLRTYGVLAPNAPLRPVVTALAPAAVPPAPASAASSAEPRHPAVSRYLLAMLLARIYEVPIAVPAPPRKDADHRLHQRCRRREQDSRPHRRIHPATTHRPSAWATALGGGRGGATSGERFAIGSLRPARTGDRVRSAHRLVDAGR